MKITFSYSPDEQKQVNIYKKMIMKEAAPYSMRIKQGQEVDQHGRKRLYMTTRTEQETERIKAKEMAAGERRGSMENLNVKAYSKGVLVDYYIREAKPGEESAVEKVEQLGAFELAAHIVLTPELFKRVSFKGCRLHILPAVKA